MGIKLIIGGDVVPSFQNVSYFERGEEALIADEKCRELLAEADCVIYNLETPVADKISPIKKDGANFCVSSKAVQGLRCLKTTAVSVANNHSKDQGADGLESTISVLKENGIEVFGYGNSFEDAQDVFRIEKDGKRISVIACAETEFTIFENNMCGAVPYHDFWTNFKIRKEKEQCDIVIILYHGGKEYYQYPSPNLQQRCHLMAKNGADYIFCQHSHCIGCAETFEGTTILYGQGNFIFHQRNEKAITKQGLLCALEIGNSSYKLKFIPVILDDEDRVCIAEKEESVRILEAFKQRGKEIEKPGIVEKLYSAYVKKQKKSYINNISGNNRFFAYAKRLFFKLSMPIYNDKGYVKLLNMFQNEAHRELIIQLLKEEVKNKNKR